MVTFNDVIRGFLEHGFSVRHVLFAFLVRG